MKAREEQSSPGLFRFRFAFNVFVSAKRKVELNDDDDRNRFAETCAGTEAPLTRRLHRFEVEAERRVERANDLHVAYAPVGPDDAFEPDRALDFRAHRV